MEISLQREKEDWGERRTDSVGRRTTTGDMFIVSWSVMLWEKLGKQGIRINSPNITLFFFLRSLGAHGELPEGSAVGDANMLGPVNGCLMLNPNSYTLL